jgi:hypothetical protein
MRYSTDMKYDRQRTWIKTTREHDVPWEEIVFARQETEEGLIEFLQQRKMMDFWPEISANEWYSLVENIKRVEEETVKAEERNISAMLTDESQNNVTTVPQEPKSSWQLYKNTLKRKRFKENAIDQIEKSSVSILNRLSIDTTNSLPIKGLVVGNVQSGKTANMAGLMAMAADHGWNMFIVLSGLVENLRKQTQERLLNDLNHPGNISWKSLTHVRRNAPLGERVQDYHFKGTNDAHIYVCLKNKNRLEGLLDWMQKDINKYGQMKILVIDDEADQGSINTADVTTNERKTINRLIVNLVEGFNKDGIKVRKKPLAMNYVSYTATPYANFLNEYAEESLYPRNFIKTLSTTNEYFGPKEIFGVEGVQEFQGIDIIRKVDQDDINQVYEIHKGHSLQLPKSLKESICWFLSATASLKVHGYKKPLTMMVHASQRQVDHSNLSKAITSWLIHEDKNRILSMCKKVWDRETKRLNKEEFFNSFPDYSGDRDKMFIPQQFSSIEASVVTLIKHITHIPLNEEGDLSYHEHIHLCVDNCSNNGINDDGMVVRLAYPSDHQNKQLNHATAFIVVGGTTLSRGLTMEGLLSTYFLRGARQADTLMQMGRWFGYRPRYELYPRIWMEDDTREKFEFLSTLEYELRETLEQYSKASADPSVYGPRVKNTPGVSWLRVTAANRQQSAEEVDFDYTGSSTQTILFNNDKDEQRQNLYIMDDFLEQLSQGELRQNNRLLWRSVKFSYIAEHLLKRMTFHEKTRIFNNKELDPFIEWVTSKTEEGLLDNWNVIVAGKSIAGLDEDKIWEIPSVGKVGKVTRTRKSSSTEKGFINIGALRAPADLYADVNKDKLSQEERKELDKSSPSIKRIGEIRKSAGLEHTPQLIIYRIDKDSKAKEYSSDENNPKNARKDLNAKEDIIGLCIRIPGIDTDTGISYGGLQIRIPGNKEKADGLEYLL